MDKQSKEENKVENADFLHVNFGGEVVSHIVVAVVLNVLERLRDCLRLLRWNPLRLEFPHLINQTSTKMKKKKKMIIMCVLEMVMPEAKSLGFEFIVMRFLNLLYLSPKNRNFLY